MFGIVMEEAESKQKGSRVFNYLIYSKLAVINKLIKLCYEISSSFSERGVSMNVHFLLIRNV